MRAWLPQVVGAVLAIASGALAGCGPPDNPQLLSLMPVRPTEVRAAVGCWHIAGWAGPTRRWLPGDATLYLDSAFAERMDTIAAPTILRVDRLRVDSAVQERAPLKLSGWGVEAESRRLIVWLGDGFTGVSMRLRQHGDKLGGTARSYTDTWPAISIPEPVRAVRVSCPTGVTDSQSATKSVQPPNER
jgi:hypothetical protein